MVPDGHAALQRLSSTTYLTSVAPPVSISDIINGSETMAGQAHAMICFKKGLASALHRGGLGDNLRWIDVMDALLGPQESGSSRGTQHPPPSLCRSSWQDAVVWLSD